VTSTYRLAPLAPGHRLGSAIASWPMRNSRRRWKILAAVICWITG